MTQPVYNYMVPAAGTPRMEAKNLQLVTGQPVVLDFREFQLDGRPFVPYGVYIDNSRSTTDTLITINEIGYQFTAPAGKTLHAPYPAPRDQTVTVSGDGNTVVCFVDFPVIPFIF